MTIIRVIDLETTGFPPDAEVIEIAAIEVMARPMALPVVDDTWRSAFAHPSRSIPPEASAIHHIVDEDVADALSWYEAAQIVIDDRVDIYAAHTAKFERAFITDAMTGGRPWICTWKCALRLWPDAPRHSNQALRYWLKPPGLDRAKAMLAHRAGPDAYVTAHLLAAMLELASVEQLIAWSNEPALLMRVPFGKDPPEGSRGMKWSEVEDGLLTWVLQRDFGEDVIHTVKVEIARREREAAAVGPADEGAGDTE